jgi:transketolase
MTNLATAQLHPTGATNLDQLCINTIRTLAMDAVQQANSGHPGLPMGMAAPTYVLWTRFLKHNPRNPAWFDRDRFILSAGHGSMLLYSLLYLTGYDLALEDLKNFRQWDSKTPGHPEYGLTPGVETTTGPLGQGFANGVGMAIAERYLAARFNQPDHTIVDHYIYAICSDGDLMEGVASEAASLAGHLKLGKLIYLYDDNRVTIEGSTDLAFTEDRALRFQAYGWHVQQVEDGNDLVAVEAAIRAAQAETVRPSLIITRTQIGYGSPRKQGTAEAHGEPLGVDEVRVTKQAYSWPVEPAFYIPEEALVRFRQAVDRGQQWEADWNARLEAYAAAHPDLVAEFQRELRGELPEGWDAEIPSFPADAKGIATRNASGLILNAIAKRVPELIGGAADLAPSTKTLIKDVIKEPGDFEPGNYGGRNLRFGVREHAMGAILNGMALHSGLIPYGATFLIFSDYMRPTIRLAALMEQHVIYVFTHDSIFLGEDGPTHQPIEQLMALRAIPGLTVIRPADANETAIAWKVAMQHRHGPVALALTRQNVPTFDRTRYASAEGLMRGAYIMADSDGSPPEIILIGTGSEVQLVVAAQERLAEQGIAARVVSMPSWELFMAQPQEYRDHVLPPNVKKRLAVEAGDKLGWCEFVGPEGHVTGLSHFGASAPAQVLATQFKLTPEWVTQRVLERLGRGPGPEEPAQPTRQAQLPQHNPS